MVQKRKVKCCLSHTIHLIRNMQKIHVCGMNASNQRWRWKRRDQSVGGIAGNEAREPENISLACLVYLHKVLSRPEYYCLG